MMVLNGLAAGLALGLLIGTPSPVMVKGNLIAIVVLITVSTILQIREKYSRQ